MQLRRVRKTHANLLTRLDEVDAYSPVDRIKMQRGELRKPQYLEQKPRLFAKADDDIWGQIPPDQRLKWRLGDVLDEATLRKLQQLVSEQEYRVIARELKGANWQGLGIDPEKYVLDRIPRSVIDDLTGSPNARLTLHRGEMPPAADLQLYDAVPGEYRDFPGRIYKTRSTTPGAPVEYHLFNLPGEDWYKQSLYMLAQFQIDVKKLHFTGALDPQGFVKRGLGTTLAEHSFESVVIGPRGAIHDALLESLFPESWIRRQAQEASALLNNLIPQARSFKTKADDAFRKMQHQVDGFVTALEAAQARLTAGAPLNEIVTSLRDAGLSLRGRADAASVSNFVTQSLDEWRPRQQALADIPPGLDATAKWRAAAQDPSVARSPLAKNLQEAQQNLALASLADQWETLRNAGLSSQQLIDALRGQGFGEVPKVKNLLDREPKPPKTIQELALSGVEYLKPETGFKHAIFIHGGKKHLILGIDTAHGDLAYHAMREVLNTQPNLKRVGMHGTAGSLTSGVPPETFVIPKGPHQKLETPSVDFPNQLNVPNWPVVTHGNVSTLMQEHRAVLDQLRAKGILTVDMEAFHIVRALAEYERAGGGMKDLRIALRVSDVATEADLGAHRVRASSAEVSQQRLDNLVRLLQEMGLVKKAE
jgi:hypothetical protein